MKAKRIIAAVSALLLVVPSVVSGIYPQQDIPSVNAVDWREQKEFYINDNPDTVVYYILSDGEVTITNIALFKNDVYEEFAVPSEIEGYPVTKLYNFSINLKNIKCLIIPESIREIEEITLFQNSSYETRYIRFENPEIILDEEKNMFDNYITVLGKSGSTIERYCMLTNTNFCDYEKMVKSGCLGGVIAGDHVVITSCDKNAEEVVIPEEINGIPVTVINDAFSDCTALKSVYIPDSVTEIESLSFSYCTALTDVRLSENLKSLPTGCFRKCTSLTEVSIPESITEIGGAFSGCTALEKVDFPANVTEVSAYAFKDTPFMEKNTDENGLFILNGCLIDGNKYTEEELVIPDGIRCVGDFAFVGNKNIKNVVMSDSVENVGRSAFVECKSLSSVKLSENITEIREDTFSDCSELVSCNLPSAVEKIGRYAFKNCEKLSDVVLPESLISMGYNVFENCTSITEMVLPASLESFPGSFSNCPSLKKVVFPENMKIISGDAFENCVELEEAELPPNLEVIEFEAFSGCKKLEKAVLPDTITTIQRRAFANCTSLSEVVIPEKEIDLSVAAFTATPWLEKLKEENTLVIINNVVFDGTQCSGDVVIPDGVTVIGEDAFNNSEITSVTIPDSVQSFGFGAFSSCKSLTEFTIPDGVTEIPDCMFSGCTSLSKVNMPESVTYIGGLAFGFCKGFEEFTVPEHIQRIGMAFDYCDNLKKITFENPECFIPSDYYCNIFYTMPTITTVCGYANSTAYEFARMTNRKFECIEVPGDANCDINVSLADSVLILQASSKPDEYGVDGTNENHITEFGITNADVYETGSGITPQDALEIQKYLLKIVSDFN